MIKRLLTSSFLFTRAGEKDSNGLVLLAVGDDRGARDTRNERGAVLTLRAPVSDVLSEEIVAAERFGQEREPHGAICCDILRSAICVGNYLSGRP